MTTNERRGTTIQIRLTEAETEALDRAAARRREQDPASSASRSSVARGAILVFLAAEEKSTKR